MIYSISFSTGNPSYDQWLLPYASEAFARGAHQGVQQVRKYTGEPYINHPARCAMMAASFALGPVAVAAMWLHDVVEDTGVTAKELRGIFGGQVADVVAGLTNIYTKSADGTYDINPRSARHDQTILKLRDESDMVRTCKMIDRIDNLRDILDYPEGVSFAKTYLPESRDIWTVCRSAHFQLGRQLDKRIVELEEQLKAVRK